MYIPFPGQANPDSFIGSVHRPGKILSLLPSPLGSQENCNKLYARPWRRHSKFVLGSRKEVVPKFGRFLSSTETVVCTSWRSVWTGFPVLRRCASQIPVRCVHQRFAEAFFLPPNKVCLISIYLCEVCVMSVGRVISKVHVGTEQSLSFPLPLPTSSTLPSSPSLFPASFSVHDLFSLMRFKHRSC